MCARGFVLDPFGRLTRGLWWKLDRMATRQVHCGRTTDKGCSRVRARAGLLELTQLLGPSGSYKPARET